jgi:hypothetical protein
VRPVADPPGLGPGAEPPKDKVPPRPVGAVVADLERERRSLVDAVEQLKLEARSVKARILSRRNLAIAGGALVALFVLRRWLKSRRGS